MQANYGKALLKIKKLEEKYGSIAAVPDYDPELVQIRFLLDNPVQLDDPKFRLSKEMIQKVINLINYGYNMADITKKLRVSSGTISKIIKQYGLVRRRKFLYMLSREGESNIYFPNLHGIVDLVKPTWYMTMDGILEKAMKLGYQIQEDEFIWGDIPDNSRYMIKRNIIYVKKGIDSYGQCVVSRKQIRYG